MIPPYPSDGDPPRELLAAYADGELDSLPVLKQQVADWLADNPDAQAELATLNDCRHWWRATTPLEPDNRRWAALHKRLEQRLADVVAAHARGHRRRRRLQGAALAAAVVVGVSLAWGWRPFGPAVPTPTDPAASTVPASVGRDQEPLAVATAQEVEILSVAGDDTPSLVVGELPVRGPLELLAPGEATLAEAGKIEDTEIRMGGSNRPLIWARIESEEEDP